MFFIQQYPLKNDSTIDSLEKDTSFSIFIGISLGNKYITKQHAKAYVEWALQHTKDNIVVLIADEIDVINWKIFHKLDEQAAIAKVQNKAQSLHSMFARTVGILARESKDLSIEERVKIVRWKDIKTARFNRMLATLQQEYYTNKDFQDTILSFVDKYCLFRKKHVNAAEKRLLANYILAELPTLLEGITVDGYAYNMILYPTYIDSSMSSFVSAIQNGMYPHLSAKLQLATKCALVETYINPPDLEPHMY